MEQSINVGRVISGKYAGSPIMIYDPEMREYPSGMLELSEYRGQVLVSINSLENTIGTPEKDQLYRVLRYNRVLSVTENINEASAATRATIGALVAGPVGLMAGFTAKKKHRYTIEVTWGDSATSVIELNDEGYEIFVACQ